MRTSALFKLDWLDAGKGLLVAAGGAIITLVQSSLQSGTHALDWKTIGSVGLAAGLSYLGKNFFTPAKLITPAQ